MKSLSLFSLSIYLFIFGSISTAMPGALLAEQVEAISIHVIDQYSPSKDAVIHELLQLQRSLIIPLQIPIPEENEKNGFLLIQMTPQYVNGLLEDKEGLIVTAYIDKTLVGYILLTSISEFEELYEDETIGFIETSYDLTALKQQLAEPNVGYIEQIGVKPGYSRLGIGSKLISASKRLKSNGLVADVFLEPLTNAASLNFFTSQGFEKSGILHQYPRQNFPHAHRTQVFFWNLNSTGKN